MAATRQDIESWFDHGVKEGATHMIIVCDTYDWSDYPVYVMPGENPRGKSVEFDGKNMQQIMECYKLSMDKAEQMKERRAFHWD